MTQRWLGALQAAFAPHQVTTAPGDLTVLASDGLTAYAARPAAVVYAETERDVVDAVRICHRHGVPFVARGSGTSLSGGAMPHPDGVVIALNRLRHLAVQPDRRLATAGPGVWNLDVSRQAAAHGLYYAPDPSSQQICSIGGNVAFNAGGAHCLKYGTTGNHVLGIRAVLPDATVVELGGESLESVGPGLVNLFVGSEGLLGVALNTTLRLLPRPESVRTVLAAYPSLEAAGDAVSAVIAAGLLPAAIEVMDRLAIKAAEAAVHPNYPADAAALMIIELDGEEQQVAAEWDMLDGVLADSRPSSTRLARDDRERAEIWKGRKSAFSAVGRLSPDFLVNDGVVPRAKLPAALSEIEALSGRFGLSVANVFHAGDGNLHPLVLYDGRRDGEGERAEALSSEILDMCIRLGGSITGEHGVGLEKRAHLERLYDAPDIETLRRVRLAVDPGELANRGKVLPAGSIAAPVPDAPHGSSRDSAPTTVEGVCEAVAHSGRVLPRGGGTKPILSTPADPGIAVLDLSGLAGIIEYDPSELVITALAGTRVADIEALLGSHDQTLAFDPVLAAAGATLGGTVASGLSGPGRYRRGGVRDFVVGARFVDGRARLVRGRGRVVKNVAGFDLPRLLVGSLGQLAVLVEISLKVFPRPEAHGTVRLRGSIPETLANVESLARSTFDIECLDVVPGEDSAELLARLAGPASVLPARLDRVRRHLGGGDVIDDDGALWEHPRELDWIPAGWDLLHVPVTPRQIVLLEPVLRELGAVRRYSAGGQVAWVAVKRAGELEPALTSQDLTGLHVLGRTTGHRVIGRSPDNELGRRVRAALDPFNRFAGW